MNKSWAIAATALVVLYPASAWLVGKAIESRIGLDAAQLNAQTPYLTVVEQRYHRGWYTSEQDITLAVGAGPLSGMPGGAAATAFGGGAQGLRFTVHSVIHHGPFCGLTCLGLARIESRLVPDAAVTAAIKKVYGATDPLLITTRLGFFGGGATTIESPPLQDVKLGQAGHFAWGGFTLRIDYGAHNDSIRFKGTAPHTVMTGADGSRVELGAMTVDSSNRRVLPLLYTGNFDLAIDRVVANGARGGRATTLENVHYGVKSSTDNGFMDTGLAIGSGAIDAGGVRLQGTHIDATLRHLQMAALETLTRTVQDYNRRQSAGTSAESRSLLAAIKQPATDLLLQNPDLHIDRISIATPSGQAQLTGVIRLRDVVAADFAEDAVPQFLNKIEADLDLSIDDAALTDLAGPGRLAGQQLQAQAQQGYIEHANGHWQAKIHYAQRLLTVNGKPFQPGATNAIPPSPPGTTPPVH